MEACHHCKKLSRADILILDEFGYVPLENMSLL